MGPLLAWAIRLAGHATLRVLRRIVDAAEQLRSQVDIGPRLV
jgi:hypothetical protein